VEAESVNFFTRLIVCPIVSLSLMLLTVPVALSSASPISVSASNSIVLPSKKVRVALPFAVLTL